jgi:hypothetical protein
MEMAMNDLGFTGSRKGMTHGQKRRVRLLLAELKPTRVHHGDCVGSDAQMDALAREAGSEIVIHPPSDPKLRAWCFRGAPTDQCWTARPYMERNQEIVNRVEALVATPDTLREVARSGTWATVRMARAKGIPIYLALPTGKLLLERDGTTTEL